ncbi:hypothetical protein FE257_008366 [Aspergillus nanangensis]|uniref:Uncharacterized protein n=1 Tax=Aspergillus nanangensis TaxID=2582783 RepID=A0AAD4GTM3_ASPNN|nr:hypothetical protein FE257_008366 [Aspergillus nanangensis]
MNAHPAFIPRLASMKSPLRIMTAIIKKLRRKRKLSSELDSRWGDASITYPNEGSWSQCEPSPGGGAVQEMPFQSPDRGGWRFGSVESLDDRHSNSSRIQRILRSTSPEERGCSSTDSTTTIPTGYYDARVRGRSKRKSPPQPLGTIPGPADDGSRFPDSSPGFDTTTTTTTTTIDIDERSPISELGAGPRGSHTSRRKTKDNSDAYSRASRSPPLSVTSRMRRCSGQSSTTEQTYTPSMPNTASSKHTSFTSSAPSVRAEDPRSAYHATTTPTYHEKKQPRRSKPRDQPEPVVRQELVPSYEDLYG